MRFVRCSRLGIRALSVSAVVLSSTALGAVSAVAGPGGQGRGSPPPGHSSPPSGSATLSLVGSTSPQQARGKFNAPGSHKPFYAHGGKGQPPSSSGPTASAVPVAALTVPGPAGSSSGITASSTDVLDSLYSQVTALGSDQNLEPPDNGLAAGNGYVVELVNDSGSIWQPSGGNLINPYPGNPFDLNKFFYVPSGYSASDPRIVFDPSGPRWIASAVAFSSGGSSYLDIDVSSTANPEGGWLQYDLPAPTDLYDQPKLGISGAQVVVSANDFFAGAFFSGAVTWVFDRAGLEAGTFLSAATFGPDSTEFSIVPVSVVPGSVEDAVWNDADCSYSGCSTGSPTLGVIEISGSPKTNNVTETISNPSIAATSRPPAATQPSPGNALNTDDDRFTSATMAPSGAIWTGGNDACTPPGDSGVRPCLRLDEISVSGTPSVLQDFDAGANGAAVMYPALGVDGSGNMAVVYSASSSSEAASVGTAGQAVNAAVGSLSTGPWLETGAGAYVDGTSTPRWGDYSGASGTASGIWVAGEYTDLSGTADWAVAGAFLTFGGGGGGPGPNSVSVSASPSTITANSSMTSTITATVTGSSGAVSGDTVDFSTSGGATCGTLSPTSGSTGSFGTVSVSYNASVSVGTCTITAKETDTGSSSSVNVNQVRNSISLTASRTSLVAGSGGTSTLTVTVKDSASSAVAGDTVTFTLSPGTTGSCGTLNPNSPLTTPSSGQVQTTYTVSNVVGTCKVTATESRTGASTSVSITQTKHRK